MRTNTNIPSLDFREYLHGTPSDRNNFINQLKHACTETGFFYLHQHGIDTAMMDKVLLLTRKFFELSADHKAQLGIEKSPCFRGYGKLLAEKTLGIGDYKETFDLGLEAEFHTERENARHLRLIGPNQWPQESWFNSLNFKNTLIQYLSQLVQLGSEIMHAITASLNYPLDEYAKYFVPERRDAYAMLRLLYYPASPQQRLGVGEHVDAGFISLLLQDDVGGLQIKNNRDEWINVPPLKHHFIVNIGQMLQSWSGNVYKATLHRVYNHSRKDRVSAPFFFEPNLSTMICLEGKEEAVVYGEHMLKIFERSFPSI